MKHFKIFLLLLLPLTAIAQINTNTNFDPAIAAPIDVRDTLTTLADTTGIAYKFPGLWTYVASLDKFYYYNGTAFTEFVAGISQATLNDSTAAIRADFPSSGSSTFLSLTDVPSTYTGQQNKMVLVDPTATSLIFVDTAGLGGGGSSSSAVGVEYPYESAYEKVYDINVDGTTNFNGGNRAYSSDSTAMMVTNGAGGAGRGVEIIGFSHAANQSYTIRIDVKDPGGQGMRLYAQWSTPQTTITTPGVHYWDFTSPSGSGSFGKEIIIATDGAAQDTIYINSIYVYEKNSGYNILPESDISSLVVDSINSIAPTIIRDSVPVVIDERTVLYAFNDFSENSDNTTCFGCTGAVSNGFYEATLTASSQVVVFGASVIDSQAYYQAYFDIDIVDSSVVVRSVWSGTTGQYNTDTITQSGTYTF